MRHSVSDLIAFRMDNSAASSGAPQTGVKRGWDQSSPDSSGEVSNQTMTPPEKKPATADLVAQAAAAAAAAAARVTASEGFSC